MDIKRDLYLKKLISRKENGMIKIVTGIRRCGKSYLLLRIFHQYLLEKGYAINWWLATAAAAIILGMLNYDKY